MRWIQRIALMTIVAALPVAAALPQAEAGDEKNPANTVRGWPWKKKKGKKKHHPKHAYDLRVSVVSFTSLKKWDSVLDGTDEFAVSWKITAGGQRFAQEVTRSGFERGTKRSIGRSTLLRDVKPDALVSFASSARELRAGIGPDAHGLASMPSQSRKLSDREGTRTITLENSDYRIVMSYALVKRQTQGKDKRRRRRGRR